MRLLILTISPILLSFILLFQSASWATSRPRFLYAAKNSSEVQMSFTHQVEVIVSNRPPSEKRSRQAIEDQLRHMFGSMAAQEVQGVPRGDHEVNILQSTQTSEYTYQVQYEFNGTILLENSTKRTYSFFLPNNPYTIYLASSDRGNYPCTDPHYQSEGDFWYFWNPLQKGCPLKNPEHYQTVTAKIKKIPNTKISYPEYSRLVDSKGNIKISLLMGMDDPSLDRDPNTSRDINAENFRQIKKDLLALNFENSMASDTEIQKITPQTNQKPYIENFNKTFERDGKKISILVQIFYGPSGIEEESQNFHFAFKDALENSSVMIYDGHSGLGGHLDLPSIEQTENFKIKLNTKKYQIYFFNSCSSYSYYNSMFFDQKRTSTDPKGTKNLDILTNGLLTYFYAMHSTNMNLIKAILAWAEGKATVSYQALAKDIDSNNLFGINGDEDNPTTP